MWALEYIILKTSTDKVNKDLSVLTCRGFNLIRDEKELTDLDYDWEQLSQFELRTHVDWDIYVENVINLLRPCYTL